MNDPIITTKAKVYETARKMVKELNLDLDVWVDV